MTDSVVEAMLRAQIAAEIASAMPQEIVTDWDHAYGKGLKKAMEIARGKA